MEKKLFAFDLDGTLLNSEQKLSPGNAKALAEASKKGHLVIMVTGRNYIYSQLSLKQHWELFNYFVGNNGAVIHSIKGKKIKTKDNMMDYNFVIDILEELRRMGGTIQVSTEWEVFTDYLFDKEVKIFKEGMKERLIDPFPSVFKMTDEDKKNIVQVSVHLEEHNVRPMQAKWIKEYGDKYEFTITSKHNIDINAKNICKLNAIKEIVSLEDIKYENVYVFGDTQNDIKGLEYYKNTFAMENALPETKKAAKYTIGHNDTDTIAEVVLKNIS